MTTIVRLRLGPADEGRRLTFDEFMMAAYEEGYKYELIDGRLEVSPLPNAPEGILDEWVRFHLKLYAHAHPEVINFVSGKARVFVDARPETTTPEPDAAAYHDFPLHEDYRTIDWADQSPVLVVEVLSEGKPEKDLVRNVELYHLVPSIKEYWVIDGRDNPNEPTLIAHVRHGKGWRVKRVAYGDTCTTKLLPGFELIIDPRR